MPISERLRKLIDFAKRKARDPEFLYRTAHRRPLDHPSQRIAEAYAKAHGLRWPSRDPVTYKPTAEVVTVRRGGEAPPPGTSTYTPPAPYRAFRLIKGDRDDAAPRAPGKKKDS